ncbi:polysaccharide biosynthesis protein [Desulfuromonas versatilis]|uniref:non-specific protein-tyrosine kinase n=1 Tax=Desulfuromonas versatilis TaxID=2802975 RepID=A0ABN6DYU3_9BACT|nr:XrtA-associated tyrosine autokinase [Desulfuromonas versatilis]BCR05288.1 polysaccharide biosynthesis protein [Desulfuromonas versatilis]
MSRIDKAIEKAAQLRDVTPLPVAPPKVEPSVRVEPPRRGRMERLLEVEPLPVDNPFLVASGKALPAVAEEYKKLKSMVIRLTKGKQFKNSLVVTSTVAAEGKSLTALNLATTLAQEYDHTVLLVDADLRKPSIHKLLGLQPQVGLVHCLKGDASLEDALVKTGIGKLVVLPAGGVVSDPVELLSSNRMKQIIKELKARYPERYVIIDTPPVLPFAEAQVLASQADGVLFVIREGCAKASHVKEALETVKGVNLLGVVYNDSSVRQKKGSYYYY